MTLSRLTRQELRQLIGTPVRSRQVEWLTLHGWPHDLDCLGCPIVLRSVALEKLGGEVSPQPWRLDEANVA